MSGRVDELAANALDALEKLRSAGRTSDILKAWCDDAKEDVERLAAIARDAEQRAEGYAGYGEILESLTAERDEWHNRAVAAEARVTELEGALRDIIDHEGHFSEAHECKSRMIERACAALASVPPAGDSARVKNCDEECWQTGSCSGYCGGEGDPVEDSGNTKERHDG